MRKAASTEALSALEEGTMEGIKVWTLFAPLGELPEDEALEEVTEELREKERRYRARTLLLAGQEPAELLKRFLGEVRGDEGILTFQVDGGGVRRKYVERHGPAATSVLAVAGVHAVCSAYVLVYSRTQTNRWGRPPRLTWLTRRFLHDIPEIREELGALERKVFRRYPALEEALRPLKRSPFFVDAERRGQVLFPINSMGEVPYALVGSRPFLLEYAYEGRKVREVRDETLVRLLRERTLLGALPPRAIRAFFRGEGDTGAVERLVAMARLGGL
jgi:hypothetical protein